MKLAYCGDLCIHCPRYVATLSGNEEELKKVAKIMQKVGWHYDLEEPENNQCRGCQDVKACEYGVKECCLERKINNCGECASYPCATIEKAFETTQKYATTFHGILSREEYEVFRKAFFLKKTNLDKVKKKILGVQARL